MSVILHMGRKEGVWITFRNYFIVPIDIHSLLAYSFCLWIVIMRRNMFANFKVYVYMTTFIHYHCMTGALSTSCIATVHKDMPREPLTALGSTDRILLLYFFFTWGHVVSGES